MISSNKIARLRQIDYIPVTQFQGLTTAATVFVSVGAGAAVFQEVSTFGINGVLLDDDADEVSHFTRIPTKWDRDNNIYVRFIFATESSTAADTVLWKFLYGLFTPATERSVRRTNLMAAGRVRNRCSARHTSPIPPAPRSSVSR